MVSLDYDDDGGVGNYSLRLGAAQVSMSEAGFDRVNRRFGSAVRLP